MVTCFWFLHSKKSLRYHTVTASNNFFLIPQLQKNVTPQKNINYDVSFLLLFFVTPRARYVSVVLLVL